MEKKTIGRFISVLRRASGMTQKELGEKLFVSDKTVSRWERDECTPELSLLPAIAEIFGITTDELLRGERNGQSGDINPGQKTRTDKQMKVMLHNRGVRFRNMSAISLGVALAAAIMALVINESFYKGTLAFGIGTVLIVAACVCQFCFTSSSLLRFDEDDDTYEFEIRQANSRVITGTAGVVIGIVSLFAFILPMGILGSSFYALSTLSAMLIGLGCCLAMMMAGYVVYVLWIRQTLTTRGLVVEERSEQEKSQQRRKLLVKTLRTSGAILLVLSAVLLGNWVLGPDIYCSQRKTFEDIEDFQAFMEDGAIQAWKYETLKGYGPEAVPGHACIFLDYLNDGMTEEVLLPPEFEKAELTGADGAVLGEYAFHPGFVRDIQVKTETETGQVKIKTHTIRDMEVGEKIFSAVFAVTLILMAVTVIVAAVIYTLKLVRRRG